ncbi:putative COP9 signalosome complex subunit 3 [Colletotrichum sojae]|uniref:Putative COP9 signalosome complex subunit 3 n=1 Tax=Colletotrichum sojae TaxID=2175907 RepID=A0A8H6JP50_9PEZI|nr:putative COP9 signalosome complex subunit 3 [Colletotrichum sojae]
MDALLLAFEPGQHPTDELYHKAVEKHIQNVWKLFTENADAVVANAPQLLEIIHPTDHSISHLAILNTIKRIDESKLPVSPDALQEYILRFLLSFDQRQIRYVGEPFYDLVKDVLACKYFPARQAIEIIAIVLRRLDPDSALLTSIHLAVVKLAYETENYDQVLPIIEKPWVFLPGMKNQTTPAYLCDMSASPAAYITTSTSLTELLKRDDVMKHEYLVAQIFTAKQRWTDAHKAYQRIVTWPTRDGGVSKIAIECYRRWILTGLLALGQNPTQPSNINAVAVKAFNAESKPYADLAALFPTINAEQFKADVDKSAETWNGHQTATLVKEVVKAYQKWQILGLADVYHKISVSEIREKTLSGETALPLETDQEVEELLQDMIRGGMLQGVLETSSDGIKYLTYLPREEEIEYTEYQRKIKDDVRIKTINKWAQASDARLAASKDYAKHIIREQKRQDKDGGQSQSADYGFEASVDEEDLMTGIQHP